MAKETKQPSLFDYLKDITYDKAYLFDPEDSNKGYVPFMVNRGLAQHLDTILLANETNKMGGLSKQFHHDYLFYSVDKKKRYGKWAKADTTDSDLLEFVKEKYSVNQAVALDYLKLFDRKELKKLKSESERKGGK